MSKDIRHYVAIIVMNETLNSVLVFNPNVRKGMTASEFSVNLLSVGMPESELGDVLAYARDTLLRHYGLSGDEKQWRFLHAHAADYGDCEEHIVYFGFHATEFALEALLADPVLGEGVTMFSQAELEAAIFDGDAFAPLLVLASRAKKRFLQPLEEKLPAASTAAEEPQAPVHDEFEPTPEQRNAKIIASYALNQLQNGFRLYRKAQADNHQDHALGAVASTVVNTGETPYLLFTANNGRTDVLYVWFATYDGRKTIALSPSSDRKQVVHHFVDDRAELSHPSFRQDLDVLIWMLDVYFRYQAKDYRDKPVEELIQAMRSVRVEYMQKANLPNISSNGPRDGTA